MIDLDKIQHWINESLNDHGHFLVELTLSSSNKIYIEVDSDKGIPISYCVELSRLIETNLDREKEDYELEVASATLGQPFKVLRQYQKNIGKEISITTKDGMKEEGILESITDDEVTLKVIRKVKQEGEKRKAEIEQNCTIAINNIKETKSIIRFK